VGNAITTHIEGELLDNIRKASNKGLVLGNDHFIDELERLNGRRLKEGRRGRPSRNVL